jgi:hypothetical protein
MRALESCGPTITITQRDVREGGVNPPLPRNCKRAQLRPVSKERLNGPESKPTGASLWEGNPANAFSEFPKMLYAQSQETGPLR